MAEPLPLTQDSEWSSRFEHNPLIHPKQTERASHYQLEFKIPFPVHIAVGGYCSRFDPIHPRLAHQVIKRELLLSDSTRLYEKAQICTKPQVPGWVARFLPNRGVVNMVEQRSFDLDEHGCVACLRMQFENESLSKQASFKEIVEYVADPDRPDEWTVKRIHCMVYVGINPFGLRQQMQEWLLGRIGEELEVGRGLDMAISKEFSHHAPAHPRASIGSQLEPISRVVLPSVSFSDMSCLDSDNEDPSSPESVYTCSEIDLNELDDLTELLGLNFVKRNQVKTDSLSPISDSVERSVNCVTSPSKIPMNTTTTSTNSTNVTIKDEENCCKACTIQ